MSSIIVFRCAADNGKCGKRGSASIVLRDGKPRLVGRPFVDRGRTPERDVVALEKQRYGRKRLPERWPSGGRVYDDEIDIESSEGEQTWFVECPDHGRGAVQRLDAIDAYRRWRKTQRP